MMYSTRLLRALGLGLIFAAASVTFPPERLEAQNPPPAKETRSENATGDSLLDLNKTFREAYARARQETLARTSPVIVVEGDNLVLLRKGQRTEVKFMPERYHTLKAVAHIPLALYVMLVPYGGGEISEQRLQDLQIYSRQLADVEKSLEGRGLAETEMERQRKIVAASRDMLEAILRDRKAKTEDVIAFTRRMGPWVLLNAADATRAQVDAMHRQVQSWKKEMTAEEWKALRVLIMGAALPRKGNLSVQYFARLLGETGEGMRIVYSESVFDETKALNLLGTYLLDTGIGSAFFNDPLRMHRDLLSVATEEYLKTLNLEAGK